MTENDLFAWADSREREAASVPPHHEAKIIDFEKHRCQRHIRLVDSALAACVRVQQRSAGVLPPAPILRFDGVRRQA
jgi:primosomal protein N'